MATKKNLSLDDYGLGDEFSDATMDFGTAPTKGGKRSPIMDLGKIAAKGAVSGIAEGAFIRQSVKKTLPEGYGSAIDFTDETVTTFKSLYNTTATQMRPLTNDLKRTTQRLMPSAGQILPGPVKRYLDTWSKDLEGQSKYNPEDAIKAQIEQSQQEIFKYEFTQRQTDRAEGIAKGEIKEGIDQTRFVTQAKMLNMISMSTQRLADYQDGVTINYQRKMLELQYRQVYLLRDTHEEQKRANAVFTEGFKALIHNTGLPDYEKLTTRNRAGGFMRNQFAAMAGGGLRNARTAFMGKLRGSLENTIKSRVGDFVNSAQNGLMMGNMMLDSKEQMDSMKEMAESMGETDHGIKGVAAGMGGSMLGQMGANKGLKWVKQYLDKNPHLIKRGNQAQSFLENLPQHASRFANSDAGEGKNPLLDLLLGFGKDTIRDALKSDPTNLHRSDYSNLQGAAVYSNQAQKSLTEIIPGYLARLLREVSILRTGDTGTPLMVYDYQKNRFDTKKSAEANALKGAFSSYGVADIKDRAHGIAQSVEDPDNPFTREEKKALADHLLKLNRRGSGIADAKTLGNQNNYTGAAAPYAEKFSAAFNKHFEGDTSLSKHVLMSKRVNALAQGVEERKAVIQDLANAGHLEMLQRTGIVDAAGENIDMDRFYALHLEDDPVMAAVGEQLEAVASNSGRRPRVSGFKMAEGQRRGRSPQRVNLHTVARAVPAGVASPAPAGGYEFQGPPHPPISAQHAAQPVQQAQALNWNDAEAPIAKATDRLHEDLLRIEALVHAGTKITVARMKVSGMSMPDLGKMGDHLDGMAEAGKAHLGKAKNFFDRSLREHFRSAKDTVQNRGQQGMDFLKENAPKARGFVEDKYEAIRDHGRRGWGKFQDTKNIYLPGEKMPRLLMAKLAAGEYIDDATGKAIQSYKDIRGAIRDKITNEIVLTDTEAKAAFVRFGPVQKLITSLGAVIKPLKEAAGRALDGAHGMAISGAAMVRAHVQKLKEHLDGPQDVYIIGNNEPVMLARIMKAGGYRLKMDPTKPIMKITEISGPVIDSEGNEVLTMSDLKAGIFDKFGRPLQTGWLRGGQIVKDFVTKHLLSAKDKLTQGLKKAKDAGMHYGGKAADSVKQGWESFSKWIGTDGIMISGGKTIVDRLTEIRDLLNDRIPGKKHQFGDRDGDGVRDGSVQDIVKKRAAEKAQAKADALKTEEEHHLEDIDQELGAKGPLAAAVAGLAKKMDGGKGLLEGGLGGIAEHLLGKIPGGKLLKKIPGVGKLATGAGKLLSKVPGLGKLGGLLELGGALGGAGEAGAGLVGAGEAAAAGEGIAAAGAGAAGLAAKGGGGLLRGGLRLAGKAAMAAPGMALTAGKWLLNARKLGGPLGFLMGGAGDALGGAVMSGLGAAGSGLLALLSSPVVLGVGAAALAGYGAYKAYQYFKNHKSLDPVNSMRYAQYGFLPTDKDHVQAVFQLEDVLTPNVRFSSKGMADLNMKKIVVADLFKLFGIDKEKKDQISNFATWFVKRFKPVYLTHLTVLHRLNGSATLSGVDKLKDDQKREYINGAKYPDGPYDLNTSPFPDLESLPAHAKDVAEAADAALKTLEGKKGDAKDGKDGKAALAATAVAGAAPGQKVTADTPDAKLDSKGKMTALAAITNGGKDPTGRAVAAGGGMVVGGVVAGSGLNVAKGLDALTAVRMKTYGLTAMEPEKVQVLLQMEAAVEDRVTVKSVAQSQGSNNQKLMQANYLGDAMAVLRTVGSRFDIVGEAGNAAFSWRKWFGARFLPTYLVYRGALATQTGQTKKAAAEQVLMGTPAQAVMVAQATVGAQADSKYGGGSVWSQTESPWAKYSLNTDPSSTKPNIAALSVRTGKEHLPEAKAKLVDKAKATKKEEPTAPKTSMWDSVKKTASDAWNSVKSVASDTWKDVKQAYSTAGTQISAAAGTAWSATKNAASSVGSAVSSAASTAYQGVKSAGTYVAQKVTASAAAIKASLLKALAAAGITQPTETAMFMAQMDTESGGFKSLSENLNYKPDRLLQVFPTHFKSLADAQQVAAGGAEAIANRVYGGRNGNTAPDDGFKYRGRGVIQLTGKANYAKYGKLIGMDLIANPDAASDPMVAAKLAIAYWKDRVSSSAAQSGDVKTVTKAINGGMNGLGDRQSKFQMYMQQAKAGQLAAPAGAAGGAVAAGAPGSSADAQAQATGASPVTGTGAPAGTTASGPVTPQVGASKTAPAAGGPAPDPMTQAKAVSAAAPSPKSSSGTGSPSGFGGSAPTPAGVPAVTNPVASPLPTSTPVAKDTLSQDMQVQTDQLKSLRSIESILTDIKKLISSNAGGAGTPGGAAGGGNGAGPIGTVAEKAKEMTRGPISMAKQSFGVT